MNGEEGSGEGGLGDVATGIGFAILVGSVVFGLLSTVALSSIDERKEDLMRLCEPDCAVIEEATQRPVTVPEPEPEATTGGEPAREMVEVREMQMEQRALETQLYKIESLIGIPTDTSDTR